MKLLLYLISLALSVGFAIAEVEQFDTQHVERAEGDDSSTYIPTTAPRENIFRALSEDERSSIEKFLRNQRNQTM